jgi:hypothetical protein
MPASCVSCCNNVYASLLLSITVSKESVLDLIRMHEYMSIFEPDLFLPISI